MFLITPIRNFYGRFERSISSVSLITGFVFDAITLERVDTLWENVWILAHLLIVAVFIILIHVQESKAGDEKDPHKAHFWYVNILQFFFGGILSTYLVFYFRSADIFVTWPFILLLVAAFVANQSFKRHYIRFSFQISLFFLSIYSFAIFLVPVVLHRIGTWVFLLSGAASLAFIGLFIVILFHFIKDKSVRDKYESRKMIALLILGIFAIVNALYFTNLIPPIPLSLKEGGVYHSVEKVAGGNYYVSDEKHSWKDYFRLFKTFTAAPGAGAYAYSAVFSPRNLNITILHEWQYYDESERAWATTGIISLPVIGGRDGGFRTYSMRSNLTPGKWRVNVETTEGKIIGRLRFNVIAVSTPPLLLMGEKE